MVEYNDDYSIKLPDPHVKDFQRIMQNVDDYMNYHKGNFSGPIEEDLAQFHKSWFYHNWSSRFRHLMAFTQLGTKGVLAIPNTNFEEWLWWFHEWAEALTDDYNEFKQLTYEALQLIQRHLEAIDDELKDHEQRIQQLEKDDAEHEKHLQTIDHEIDNIHHDLDDIHKDLKDIHNDIKNINNHVDQLQHDDDGTKELLQKIINKLTDSGAWDKDKNDFKPGFGIACGNINLFGGAPDGGSFIRTNSGRTENDVTAGI